jgi:hypothetical protein
MPGADVAPTVATVTFGSHIQDAVFAGSAFEYAKSDHPGAAEVRCQVALGFFGHPARAAREHRQLLHRWANSAASATPAYRSSVSHRLCASSAAGIIRLLHPKGSPVWIEATHGVPLRRVLTWPGLRATITPRTDGRHITSLVESTTTSAGARSA